MRRFVRFTGFCLSLLLCFPLGVAAADPLGQGSRIAQAPGRKADSASFSRLSSGAKTLAGAKMLHPGFAFAHGKLQNRIPGRNAASESALSAGQKRDIFMRSVRLSREMIKTGSSVASLFSAASAAFSAVRSSGDSLFTVSGSVVTGLTEEGKNYFRDHHRLEVPSGITAVGDEAFKSLGLTEAVLPPSVAAVGDRAFYDNALTAPDLSSLHKIGKSAFQKNKLRGALVLKNIESLGESAFADNELTSLEIKEERQITDTAARLTEVPANAFRDNRLTGVSLPDTVTVLGDACFANNDLGDFSFRRGLVTVGDAVFSGNHFSQAAFPDTLRNFGRDVFANNKRWIKIDPSSPAAVKNAKYSTGFGNVRNSVSLQISYVDENGVDIVSPRVMDSEFFDPNGVYYKDSENTMDVPRFAGFTAQGATGATLRGDKLYFTPDRDKYALKIRYRRENVLPYINGEFNKRFAVGEKIDRAALLKGMYAYDTKGQSISVTVFPDEIKDPKQNTVYDVWYRVTDERGNTAVTPGKILVGMDWPQMPICTGWKVKDFTYDNDGKITGFNPQGNHAHATEIPCWPSVDTYGRRVSGIGRFAFSGKGLTKIPSDWGEIRYIDYYAFNGNKLVALPASWGKVVDVSSYAFSNNKLRSLPPSWGEISSIDSGSFEHNEIGSLPLSWGKVGSVSEDAFANNKISSIPDSWGRISYLQNGAFAHNRIRKIPPSWGEITAAGEETRRNSRYGVFQDNEIEEIPPSWEKVKELGLSAFSGNKIGRIPSSWGKIDELPSYVFSNNRVREIPGSWGEITEIGESAFSGNKISVLPDTWNKITEIKSSAFSGNQIENLPGSWENVGKIGGYAFNGNKIAILPPAWGKITEIDSGTFGSNKIRKIPDSWGEITAVRGGAFKNNPLDTVPQTWGKINYLGSEAFWETNVTSIPDSWGEITEINRRLFGAGLSSLPLSWGKATKIDDEAFVGYKLTKIPSDWGEITQIGWRAFEENNIAALPASWGKVNYIGWYAFKSNQISTFPDSWGEITQIGKQTFYGNKIPSVPQSWGKVTNIEEEAFKDNKIADFARDWGSVTEIGKSAFESNLIPALPASWGKVAKFGEEAFYGNKIEKIPSNWGEITELPLFVFGSNRITEIPSDWGKITTIAQQPFSGSKITNIPDSWGKITSLFTDYFLEGCPVKKLPLSWGKLKPHSGFDYIFGADSGVDPGVRKNISLAFEEDDEDVEAVAKMLERQYAFYLGRPAYIHPKSGVRPAGVEDTEYMKIIEGPVNATITVRYTDSAGKKLRPDETLVYDLRKLMKYNEDNGLDPNNKIVSPSPAAIPGYRMPAKQRVRVDGAAHEVTFVYTPLSAAELNKGRLTLNGTVTDALVNSELETELAFDSAQSLGDGSINVNFDPRYVSYVRGSGSSFIEKEQVIAPGVLHIKLKPINTGTKIVFYLRWKLAPRITPSGKNFPVSAVLLDGDNPLLKTKTVNLRGYYNLPTFEKKVRKDVYGYVGDFDSDPGGTYVSETGMNYAIYHFGVKYLYRNMDRYTITDELPEYEKHDGTKARAVFVAEENPGWTQGPDNKLTYTAARRLPAEDNALATLRLHFPGAKTDASISNAANAHLVPEGKTEEEKDVAVSSSDSFQFHRVPIPTGEQYFAKKAAGPHYYPPIGSYVIYDTDNDKKSVIPWKISLGAGKAKMGNPDFTDGEPDPRLKYTSIVPDTHLIGADVILSDSAGRVKYVTRIEGKDEVLLPEEITKQPNLTLEIKNISTIAKGDSCEFTVKTEIRDPAQPLYDETAAEEKQVLHNGSVLKVAGQPDLHAQGTVRIRPAGRKFTAIKRVDDARDILSGNERVYSVGSEVENDYSDPSSAFELIDLVPKGVDVKDVRLTEAFALLPGARYDILPNYGGTGQTAVKFSADEVETEEPVRHIADISMFFSTLVDDTTKKISNNVYLHATGAHTRYGNQVTDPPVGPGKWSKAAVVSGISTTKELYVEKKVRTENGPWREKISTPAGAPFDYSLRVVNGTELQVNSPVIYDILPRVGDTALYSGERTSQFSNRVDPNRAPVLPAGWSAFYSCDPGVSNDNLERQNWTAARCADVTAVKFTGASVPPRTKAQITLPMLAGPAAVDVQDKAYWYKEAVNSFIYNDKRRAHDAEYGNKIESNLVSNKIIAPFARITFRKLGITTARGVGKTGTKPLSGGLFGLYDGSGKLRKTASAAADGTVEFVAGATVGWTIRELRAPAGFGLSNTVYRLEEKDFADMDPVLGVYRIKLRDMVDFPRFVPVIPSVGSVEFTKVDAAGKPLKGVQFRLTPIYTKDLHGYDQRADVPVQTVKSNEDGLVKFYRVPVGSYRLEETDTPLRHVLRIDPIEFSVKYNGHHVVLGKNGKIANDNYYVPVYKLGVRGDIGRKPFGQWQSADGELLSGAEFSLFRGGNKIAGNITGYMQENGSYTYGTRFLNLQRNVVYELRETKAPDNYEINGSSYRFMINTDGDLCDGQGKPFLIQDGLFVPDEQKGSPSKLTVTKKDPDDPDAKPDGAGFALFRKEGDTYVRVAVAETKDGTAVFDNLTAGEYQAREIKAPSGYGKSLKFYNFAVDKYNAQSLTWTLDNYRARVHVLKFEPVYKGVTKDFAAGAVEENSDYRMWRTAGESYDVGIPLAGAHFEIRNAAGAVQEELTTDESGNAVLGRRLDSDARYRLCEVKPPEGYVRRQSCLPFRINDYAALDGFNGDIALSVPNTKGGAMVTVSKMAKDTGLPLAGARFKLTGPRGKNPHGYGKELVTDENGILSFDGLDYGVDYTLRETAAPKGYALDPTEHKVQVKDDSEPVKNLRFYNRLSTANIKLLKTDGDGRPLSGVRFGLCDLLGKCVVLPDSDSGGLIGFSVVRGREYVLRELDTVAGYALLPQPVRFGVDGDGAVSVADGGVDSVSVGRSGGYSVLRVVNYRQGRVPLSGGFGFYWFVLPGCLVLAAGVFVLFKFKREGELG